MYLLFVKLFNDHNFNIIFDSQTAKIEDLMQQTKSEGEIAKTESECVRRQTVEVLESALYIQGIDEFDVATTNPVSINHVP